MAHYQHELTGDLDSLVLYLDHAIPQGSITAKYEAGSDHRIGDARMVVRAYERFSAWGGNRVSLCISILSVGEKMALSAVSSGGSKAVLFKVNTFGEEAFLSRAVQAIAAYGPT
jgi:hypothetical protein